MAIYVAENSPGRCLGYWDWCEALSLVAYALIFACKATDARSHDIVIGVPSASIVTVPVVNEGGEMCPASAGVD